MAPEIPDHEEKYKKRIECGDGIEYTDQQNEVFLFHLRWQSKAFR
jgi:hypothetical protein